MSVKIRYAKLAGPSEAEVSAAKATLTRQEEAIRQRETTARVQCSNYGVSRYSPIPEPCGRWFPIASAVFVDTKHWVPPYGCTGGGYWTSGEGSFVCPHCGFLNRCYERKEVSGLRRHFERIVTAYEPEICLTNRLKLEGLEGYPYPPKVKALLDLEAAREEIAKAEQRVAALEGEGRVTAKADRNGNRRDRAAAQSEG